VSFPPHAVQTECPDRHCKIGGVIVSQQIGHSNAVCNACDTESSRLASAALRLPMQTTGDADTGGMNRSWQQRMHSKFPDRVSMPSSLSTAHLVHFSLFLPFPLLLLLPPAAVVCDCRAIDAVSCAPAAPLLLAFSPPFFRLGGIRTLLDREPLVPLHIESQGMA